MKKLSFLLVFPLITLAMDPAKFTPEQIEAFKKGEDANEQHNAQWTMENKNEILQLLLQARRTKEELKKQLGQDRYNALEAAWDIETIQELSQECLTRKRPFEFNKKVRVIVTDQDVTTCLPNDSITLPLDQFKLFSIPQPELAMISVAMMPAGGMLYRVPIQEQAQEERKKSKNPFSCFKKWITRK